MTVYVAVVGPGDDGPEEQVAKEVGRRLAEGGAVVVCGGLGGVMAAACQGAKAAGGLTVGILPGDHRSAANPWVDVAVATGLGEARNTLVVRAADAVVAVGGGYGTLSEIAFALKLGRPVVGLGTWTLSRADGVADTGIIVVASPEEAAGAALALAQEAFGARLGKKASMPDPDHSEIAAELDAEGIPDLDDSDASVEGMMAPRDFPVGSLEFGTTVAEERRGETLAERLLREEPELKPGDDDTGALEALGSAAPDQVELDADDEVGRLLDAEPGPGTLDENKEVTATEVSEGEYGLTAEEAAMHETESP